VIALLAASHPRPGSLGKEPTHLMSTPMSFSEEIATLARGTLDDEATAKLHELVEAVSHYDKGGKLVLELAVDPAGSGGRTVTIAGKVTVKAPQPAPEISVRFVGTGGSLHRDDPVEQRLPGIPFRDAEGEVKVVAETGEIRRVDEAGGAPRTLADDPAPEVFDDEDRF
jgi:hypothetical protein